MSIKINDLTVRFKNKVTAINHADLEIPNGVFGLLGENGAGKTTLMRVLTTVLTPTSGTVRMDGMLYCEGNYPKIQRQIGYLPQEIDLYPGSDGPGMSGIYGGSGRRTERGMPEAHPVLS